MGAYGGAGASDVPRHHPLLIQFDERDRVVRFERTTRPLAGEDADVLRHWARATVAKADAAGPKAIVLLRIECSIDGEAKDAFDARAFGRVLFVFGLGTFDSFGIPHAKASKFLSDDVTRAGWTYFELAPGTYYLAVLGPETSAAYAVRRLGNHALAAAPCWRIDVTDDAGLVYVGTLRTVGSVEGKSVVRPASGDDTPVVDERDAASALLRQEFPDRAAPQVALMTRWRPGDPVVLRDPRVSVRSEDALSPAMP